MALFMSWPQHAGSSQQLQSMIPAPNTGVQYHHNDNSLNNHYLNLVASQHHGYLVPTHNSGHTIVEVDDSPVQVSADKRSDVSRPQDRIFGDSSTVMGAITLLGFLNLLGYIQSVLSGAGRRRRRSVDGGASPRDPPVFIPVPPVSDFFEEVRMGLSYWMEEQEEQERMLAKDRQDPPTRRTSAAAKGTFGNFLSRLTQRIKLAANVMGFLVNPEPSRIRRSLDAAVQRAVRSKRFTTSMNAWYDDLAGMNYDGTSHQPQNSLLSKLMLGLGRQILGR